MKKIEKDAEDQLSAIYLLWAKNDSQMTDLKPSNSRWRNEMLRRAFWYDGEILNCGLPRVEYLIKNKPEKYAQIRKQYGLSEKTKIFLYAPTFRQNEEGELYNLDFQQTKKALEKRFGGEWIGFRRLHPVATQTQRLNLAGIVVDVTDYPDMEDLMLACDLLITDYSSCLFETFFLNIPAFLYVVDKELYIKKERGLYWEIDKLPFPKAISNQEMALQIETYDPKQYQSGLEDLKKTIGFFEDQTHATEQLVERIRIEQSK
jgi:CDP-glycerol glycerophosphotransferase